MSHQYEPPDRNPIRKFAQNNMALSLSVAFAVCVSILAVAVDVLGFPIAAAIMVATGVIVIALTVAFVIIPMELLRFIK